MFDAPRCREWTPLATQQLRLRSLIQIVGYNIRPPERSPPLPTNLCSYYFTLHETGMSAPFYTSEKISSPHPKWRELHADITQRKSSTNVVIRIWCHVQQECPDQNRASDIIIQTWGVYFSGLRLIGANLALDFTCDSFKTNTLVFQMHGGYFCSYKSLNLKAIPTENLYEYSVSSSSSGTCSSQRIPIETNYLQNHRIIKESRSVSPKRLYRNDECGISNSPVERGFRQNFATSKPSSYQNTQREEFRGDDDIYEHSPEHGDVKVFTTSDVSCDTSKRQSKEDLYRSTIDLSETAENFDLRQEDGIPKCRYLCLNFLKSEIRPSYNATKLQSLHLLQYSIKKRKDAVKEMKERIYKKCAIEKDDSPSIDCQLIHSKVTRSQRSLFSMDEDQSERRIVKSPRKSETNEEQMRPNVPRLTLKLNDLLSYKIRPSPRQRQEHLRLTRHMEVLRFKRTLLVDERDSKMAAIRALKDQRAALCEQNQDCGSELMTGYHSLSRRLEHLRQSRTAAAALRELVSRARGALASRRGDLLSEMRHVFSIECTDDKWTICGVPLPIFDDDTPRRGATFSDAVAAGLAAQCSQVASQLLCQPLRYPIRMLGSATEIIDELTHELPEPRIPLYPRAGDSTLFRYGIFLLNKCCTQLLYGRGLYATDVRHTLGMLYRLLTYKGTDASVAVDTSCPHSQSLRSLVASDRGLRRQFNRFKDSVDGQSPAVCGMRRHRHSRSVGSYRDDRQEILSTTSVMGSEPFLHEVTSANDLQAKLSHLKPHYSDSQISRSNDREREVIFTLGDAEETLPVNSIETEPALVKISSNNGDCQSAQMTDQNETARDRGEKCVCEDGGGKEMATQENGLSDCQVKSSMVEDVIAAQNAEAKKETALGEVGAICDCSDECIEPKFCSMVEEVIVINSEASEDLVEI